MLSEFTYGIEGIGRIEEMLFRPYLCAFFTFCEQEYEHNLPWEIYCIISKEKLPTNLKFQDTDSYSKI